MACFPPVSAYVWFHTSLVFRCSWSCPLLSLGFMSMSVVHLPIHRSSVFLTFSLQTLLQMFEITRRNYSVSASPYSLHPVMSFWDKYLSSMNSSMGNSIDPIPRSPLPAHQIRPYSDVLDLLLVGFPLGGVLLTFHKVIFPVTNEEV